MFSLTRKFILAKKVFHFSPKKTSFSQEKRVLAKKKGI